MFFLDCRFGSFEGVKEQGQRDVSWRNFGRLPVQLLESFCNPSKTY